MGADQIAAIRPALNELLQAAESNEPGAGELCATFTVPEYPMIWVQVIHGAINASYPHLEEPGTFLSNANVPTLPGLVVENWEPRRFATFAHEAAPTHSIAQFLDRLLVAIHALDPGEYEVDVEFERLAV